MDGLIFDERDHNNNLKIGIKFLLFALTGSRCTSQTLGLATRKIESVVVDSGATVMSKHGDINDDQLVSDAPSR